MLIVAMISGCATFRREAIEERPVGAGFRFSEYGPDYDPGPQYWLRVGQEMTERFPGSEPETVWIVSRLKDDGTLLNFPVEDVHPLILGSEIDENEAVLDLFDRFGFWVWLQAEPGHAPVEDLIRIVLERYKHHPSVVGFGVDVEWFESTEKPEGRPVTDARLFLKHWEIGKMPPTAREGLLFIDDSQILPSLEAMVDEFAEWGRAFSPAPVGFQYGYPSDRPWWSKLDDPPRDVGQAILKRVPNTEGLYWVDFTVLDLFPPGPDDLPPPEEVEEEDPS
jgi:hypothetical protein